MPWSDRSPTVRSIYMQSSMYVSVAGRRHVEVSCRIALKPDRFPMPEVPTPMLIPVFARAETPCHRRISAGETSSCLRSSTARWLWQLSPRWRWVLAMVSPMLTLRKAIRPRTAGRLRRSRVKGTRQPIPLQSRGRVGNILQRSRNREFSRAAKSLAADPASPPKIRRPAPHLMGGMTPRCQRQAVRPGEMCLRRTKLMGRNEQAAGMFPRTQRVR